MDPILISNDCYLATLRVSIGISNHEIYPMATSSQLLPSHSKRRKDSLSARSPSDAEITVLFVPLGVLPQGIDDLKGRLHQAGRDLGKPLLSQG